MDQEREFIPAFPGESSREYFFGMELRDYFAAKAMQALVAGTDMTEEGSWDLPEIAGDAYDLADAMVARSRA